MRAVEFGTFKERGTQCSLQQTAAVLDGGVIRVEEIRVLTTISNIDLHSHTTASDGALSPEKIVQRAYARGLNVLAITDHDLVAGVAAAVAAAQEGNAKLRAPAPDMPAEDFLYGTGTVIGVERGVLERTPEERQLTIIPGVEFSTLWQEEQIHVVGLFVDITHPQLLDLEANRKEARQKRAIAIGDKLARLGIEQAYERCVAAALPGAAITRGNYARLIFQDGKAKTVDDAFHRFLRRGQPAYVPSEWGPVDEVVAAIKAAGGVAVLAHPRRYNISNQRLRKLIYEFRQYGGEALEVASSQQKPTDREYLTHLCEQYELLASLGSDFHAEGPYRDLGQNIDLPEKLTPVWSLPEALKFGLEPSFKQRVVHVSYKKGSAE